MPNRRLRKRVKKELNTFFGTLPFLPGCFVRLEEALFFIPPGVYRFEGVSGSLAHFSVGWHRFTVHREFLSRFTRTRESEQKPLREAEAVYEQGVQELIARYSGEDESSNAVQHLMTGVPSSQLSISSRSIAVSDTERLS